MGKKRKTKRIRTRAEMTKMKTTKTAMTKRAKTGKVIKIRNLLLKIKKMEENSKMMIKITNKKTMTRITVTKGMKQTMVDHSHSLLLLIATLLLHLQKNPMKTRRKVLKKEILLQVHQ